MIAFAQEYIAMNRRDLLEVVVAAPVACGIPTTEEVKMPMSVPFDKIRTFNSGEDKFESGLYGGHTHGIGTGPREVWCAMLNSWIVVP